MSPRKLHRSNFLPLAMQQRLRLGSWLEKGWPCCHLDVRALALTIWENRLLSFEATQFMSFDYGSPSNRIQGQRERHPLKGHWFLSVLQPKDPGYKWESSLQRVKADSQKQAVRSRQSSEWICIPLACAWMHQGTRCLRPMKAFPWSQYRSWQCVQIVPITAFSPGWLQRETAPRGNPLLRSANLPSSSWCVKQVCRLPKLRLVHLHQSTWHTHANLSWRFDCEPNI